MKKYLDLIVIIFINIAGVLLVLYFSYQVVTFAKLEERNYYDAGDSIGFFANTWAIFLCCLLVNGVFAVKATIDIFLLRSFHALYVLGAVVILWVLAFIVVRFNS